MSANATLPDPKVAYETLFDNVHAQAFFGQLAAHGIVPATQKEAADLLDMGGKLRAYAQDPAVKQAAAANSPISAAAAELDAMLGDSPVGKQAAAQERVVAVKRAAAALAQHPDIYNAVVSLRQAAAAQQQQQAA
jgi:hypothetical protein